MFHFIYPIAYAVGNVFAVGILFIFQSVQFFSASRSPPPAIQHLNKMFHSIYKYLISFAGVFAVWVSFDQSVMLAKKGSG